MATPDVEKRVEDFVHIENDKVTFIDESGNKYNIGGKKTLISVNLSSDQTITSGTEERVEFDDEIIDQQDEYDNSTDYEFTAKYDGIYLIMARCTWINCSVDDQIKLHIYKNTGSEVVVARNYTRAWAGTCGQMTFGMTDLSTSDKIYIKVFGQGGDMYASGNATGLSIIKVG